ncbi:conjugal transfer protein TraG [Thiomicrospira aerophila AL3]|uniref:Conjugal transfer protein TraG n=1 Tax=Thiomicrospira aerophila AL3 TaxID=717772 RepID=W0DSG8_9GAMM|nr:type IV conjugative transfer system coupling protein TraD [Thiomicrospira aerophila]AHF01397.1 conjugal transfer protein TraG [Thiomicrospira aerophila AL3]
MIFKNHYPVEALLRPPVEFYAALTAWTLALIAVTMPTVIMMTDSVAYASAGVLFLFGLRRFRQGYAVWSYHRHLVRLPYYGLRPRQIPVSNRFLFLGLGFKWTQTHTQRLLDTTDPVNKRFITPNVFYRLARQIEFKLDRLRALAFVISILSSSSRWNPVAPLPPVGGNPAIHAVGMPEGEDPIRLPIGERVGHILVLGATRVGKTRLAEILITQDIRRGDVVVVMDPKGDADLLMRCKMEAERAKRPFFAFHLGFPEISARYNGIGTFSKITEPAGRLTDALPSEGNSAAFKEFGWRFANIIIQADVALGNKPHYQSIRRYINNIEPLLLAYGKKILTLKGPDGWANVYKQIMGNLDPKTLPFALKDRNPEGIALLKLVEQIDFYDPVLDGLLSAFKYDRTYFDKIVSSLGPLLEKLTTGRVAELIAPDYEDIQDKRPIFDWMSVIRQNAVVYVGLDALSDSTVASAVGASMFADLTSVSGFVYKHGIGFGLPNDIATGQRKVAIHADEFNELVGDQFIPMINKAGGSGYQVTAYTQTVSDIEARIGSKAKSGQIQGNFNNLIMMRVKEPMTAEVLTNQLPMVKINELMQVSGVGDSSDPGSGVDFTSKNEDRLSTREVAMIGVHDVIKLPKGQAFALIEGGQLYKLRVPMPEKEDDPNITTEWSMALTQMKAKYKTGSGLMQRDNLWLDDQVQANEQQNLERRFGGGDNDIAGTSSSDSGD